MGNYQGENMRVNVQRQKQSLSPSQCEHSGRGSPLKGIVSGLTRCMRRPLYCPMRSISAVHFRSAFQQCGGLLYCPVQACTYNHQYFSDNHSAFFVYSYGRLAKHRGITSPVHLCAMFECYCRIRHSGHAK